MTFSNLSAFEKLPQDYLVIFGSEEAPIEIVQYYSMSCPHCIQMFNSDFPRVKEEFIDSGKLRYVFHPVPMDLTTVQFMCCMENLEVSKKELFLSVMLEEVSLDNADFNVVLMKKAVELLGHPVKELDQDEYIKKSKAFQAASTFIMQEDSLTTVPSIEVGGKVIEKTPDYSYISLIMNKLFIKDSEYEH